ncbi:MAG: hypothetical protein H6767_00345 [Candidatus Peribacteria bacterium]|nr:MAG: hypothetical protein H6767_00345 [Candidatus Peribacteria bacterium]
MLKDVLIKQLKEQGFTILYQAENKVNELLNDRIKDIYGSDAYYVYFSNWDTEFDNTPVMREYIDLMSKVRN